MKTNPKLQKAINDVFTNRSWVDALPKSTDKCEAIIHSASTLNPDGTETEYYNRERDGHKELEDLLPATPDDPDDLRLLNDYLYRTKDDRIKELEESLLYQNSKLLQLTEENKRLKEQLFPFIQNNY